MAKPAKIEDLSFEEALSELETIVHSLESGQTALQDSISAYERGAALKKYCEGMLKDAQMKIEKLSVDASGTVTTKTFTEE